MPCHAKTAAEASGIEVDATPAGLITAGATVMDDIDSMVISDRFSAVLGGRPVLSAEPVQKKLRYS